MESHIRGCVEHALKENNAGIFGTSAESQKPAAAKSKSDPQPDRKSKAPSGKAGRTSKAKA